MTSTWMVSWAADHAGPGHQDVPASEHTGVWGIQDWGRRRTGVKCKESCQQQGPSVLTHSGSAWAVFRGSQEEKKQPQGPGHIHGGGWKISVLLSTSAGLFYGLSWLS